MLRSLRLTLSIVLALAVLTTSCQQERTTLDEAKLSKCQPDNVLAENSTTLNGFDESFCTALYSNLAPPKPEGAELKWTRENPYPALPDYMLYPDTHALQINGMRLQRIASCLHKRCLAASSTPKRLCSDPSIAGCSDPKGAFMLDSILQMASECTAEPSTVRHVVTNLRSLYEKQEGKPMLLCDTNLSEKNLDLAISFGRRVNACVPGNEDCPVGHSCTLETVGNRCRPIEPPPVPEIPGVAIPPYVARKALGSPCTLSQHCNPELVCGNAPGVKSTCSLPCGQPSDCPPEHLCFAAASGVAFCTPSCEPSETGLTSAGQVCLPAEAGGRVLDVPLTSLQKAHQAVAGKGSILNLKNTTSENATTLVRSLKAGKTCGNGQVELPEECDAGEKNGVALRGAWCTKSCTVAECGDNIRVEGEACECTLGYEAAFAKSDELRRIYQLPTTCPGRHAITDGSEKALGFSCHSCSLVHARHMRDARQNSHFLPEFDPLNPPQTGGYAVPEAGEEEITPTQ